MNVKISYSVENNIRYREIFFEEKPPNEIELVKFLKEYEWNKLSVIKNGVLRGPFYTRFEKGHNDFGPCFKENNTEVYMINDEELTHDDFMKYQRKEKLNKITKNKKP